MWYYQQTDELYHYGILGMKWGRRKNRKTIKSNEQKKAEKIVNMNKKNWTTSKIHTSGDYRRLLNFSKGASYNFKRNLRTNINTGIVNEMFGINSMFAKKNTKKQISIMGLPKYMTKEIANLMGKTVTDTAVEKHLARKTLKKFNKDGKYKKSEKDNKKVEREEYLYDVYKGMRPILVGIGKMTLKKAANISRNSQIKRNIYEKWGNNILPKKSGPSRSHNSVVLNKNHYNITYRR